MTMIQPGQFEYETGQLSISGDWTVEHYTELKRGVEVQLARGRPDVGEITLNELAALDTAGAALLAELIGAERLEQVADWQPGLPQERLALLKTVAQAVAKARYPDVKQVSPAIAFLAETGQRVIGLWHQQRLLLGFIGQTLASLGAVLLKPGRWRLTPLVAHIHQTGFNAVLIVALLTFLVGAVVAFLGATVLRDFGATIYTVDLVAFSFLREFGVLLAAILLAGRTASAFTAHIGAMKANEEIDALRAIGLDPIELLVLPRVLATMITLPMLSFIGMLSGIFGGALVCVLLLDIPGAQFISILEQNIAVQHFLVGLAKAPFFAFIIAVIGCLEGFKVSGSAQSVGEHTTSAVVQSIFMVIVLDAVAAIFFQEMGW
ncbi:ABC transporter permease [Marinobacter salicampi]|uniref:ABC transporter permease n=1 Tax=Marinobacter salicampi TaxID=435907 RepID=UPI00140BA265|nr:ABC transporter permease [Marinobacter salicampi]